MGINSDIEWTHHTFNPWWGCTKVSQACKNCYAEAWARRTGHDVWGNDAHRFFSDNHWKQPLKWNESARAKQSRERVFCASMADVFEQRAALKAPRERLWALINETEHLDWLLLTKRPENVLKLVPWSNNWPNNVWLGVTIENQEALERRMPFLEDCPAKVRFLSCEPLLGPLNLSDWVNSFEWAIAGGESGPRARPSDPAWFRDLRDFLVTNAIPFHFKQWGAWAPEKGNDSSKSLWKSPSGESLRRYGKKKAGRRLDGTIWDQFPRPLEHVKNEAEEIRELELTRL